MTELIEFSADLPIEIAYVNASERVKLRTIEAGDWQIKDMGVLWQITAKGSCCLIPWGRIVELTQIKP